MGSLKVELCGITLDNPIIPASGTFGFGYEFASFYDINILGSISLKGTTLEPRYGNPLPRIAECPSGLINAIGLQNPGVDKVVNEEVKELRKVYKNNIIANVGGGCIEDYEIALEKLRGTDIDMIELNISCPNVKSGGMAFGIKSEVAYEVVKKGVRDIDAEGAAKLFQKKNPAGFAGLNVAINL